MCLVVPCDAASDESYMARLREMRQFARDRGKDHLRRREGLHCLHAPVALTFIQSFLHAPIQRQSLYAFCWHL